MASLWSNIKRGAIRVSDTLVVGGHHETCNVCDSTLSSDGCSNLECPMFRGEPLLQLALRKRTGLVAAGSKYKGETI
jgi:hypothetical protein